MRTVTFFRLCSRAPWTTSASVWLIGASLYRGEQTFGNGLLVEAARHRTRRFHGRARAVYGYGVVVVVVWVGCEDVPPSSPPAVSDAFIWPRISPPAFLTVCTLTYVRPSSIARSCLCEIVAVPRWPLLHGPHNATITGPAFPTLPAWIWAAIARPVSFENVRRHVSRALSFANSTALPVKRPVAPTWTPRGFGTSKRALRLAVTLYVSFCCAANARPAANSAAPTAIARNGFSIVPPDVAYTLPSGEEPRRFGALAPCSSPAAENEAADGEPEPERAQREGADRDEPPPQRQALPAPDRLLFLGRQRLAASLLARRPTCTQAEIDVVEQFRRLVRHGASVPRPPAVTATRASEREHRCRVRAPWRRP